MSALHSIPKMYSASMAAYRQNPSKFQMGFALSVICGTTLYFANKKFHFTTTALDLGEKVASYTYGPLGRLTNFDIFLTEHERRLKSLYQWKKAGGATENRTRACEILIESMSTGSEVPLDLSGLGLTSLPLHFFLNLEDKQHLDLSGNNLGHFLLSHVDFLNKYTLKSLNLSHNNLKDSELLFAKISDMDDLEKLDLSNNRLTTFPALSLSRHWNNGEFVHGRLTHLNLYNNRLSNTSFRFVDPPDSLCYVNLSGNGEISKLNSFFTKLREDCKVILTGTTLYQSHTLTLSQRLNKLPTWLGRSLPHLRHLKFIPSRDQQSYTALQLKKFRERLACLPQLESLDISGQKLSSLPDLSNDKLNLKELIARDNAITTLPPDKINPRLK